LGTGACQDFKSDLPLAQLLHECDEMFEIAPEPIEIPDHERIARLEGLETGGQTGTVLLATRGKVLITNGISPRQTKQRY
jgi:hypothetical protein